MAMSVEKSAKTVQEAIDSALQELQASVDDVVIEVLDEGDAGILGIGRKPARVLVTLESATVPQAVEEPVDTTYYGDDEEYTGETESPEETASVDFVSRVLAGIGIRGQISSYREDSTIFIDVDGSDVGAVIGRRGESLDALQYLSTLVACKNSEERVRVVLDIGGYRRRREASLVSLAERTAAKVARSGSRYSLEPMNPAERRVVHTALQGYPGVMTFSEGVDPERRVIVAPAEEVEEAVLAESPAE
ncbi:MAG: protein jag [Clostridiaceae bacterium]|jgi:spoIIIJ-associated protein|nr:protein jag [Clostridiaceae bacterium]